VKRRGHEKLRTAVMLSHLADGKKLTAFVILRRRDVLKGKIGSGIIEKCNEKGQVTEEVLVK
jgi:hypothetical protein